jgi:hypothetical protein
MTLLMTAWHRRLPKEDRYPLPPHEITMNAIDDANAEDIVDTPGEKRTATLAAHFGYGGGAGALYAATNPFRSAAARRQGGLFGATLWTVSYLGIMPAVGWHRPATREPASRNILMLTANILWGAVTGFLCGIQESHREKSVSAFPRATRIPNDVIPLKEQARLPTKHRTGVHLL